MHSIWLASRVGLTPIGPILITIGAGTRRLRPPTIGNGATTHLTFERTAVDYAPTSRKLATGRPERPG